jgi:hypothetical protein
MIANPETMLSDGFLKHHWVAGLSLPQRALLFTTIAASAPKFLRPMT